MSSKLKRNIIIALICCLLAFFLLWRVDLGGKYIFKASKNISVTIDENDINKLSRLPFLERADLSGSTCYSEIIRWQHDNPDVQVLYTVELPNGQIIDSTAESAALSFKSSSNFKETAECLAYLPQLKTVEILSEIEAFRMDALELFASVRPDIDYIVDFTISGSNYSTGDEELKLSSVDRSEAGKLTRLLPFMYKLKKADLGSDVHSPSLSFSDIASMVQVRPDVDFLYEFDLYGKHFSLSDTEMDLNHIPISDEGRKVSEVLACMPQLTYLDMDSCGVSDEAMAKIRDAYPDVKVVWRIWFGHAYSVRTDVETILASKPSKGGIISSRNSASLKYCTEVRHLDLGHNPYLDDISFVSYMPKLEVAILAMAEWSDTSPLADCPELEYLEIQTTNITDISPLAGLKKLKHLNICYLFELDDISPLYNLPQLERLWIGCLDPVPEEQIEKMQSIAPDCVINTTTFDPTYGGWRYLSDSEGGVNGLAPRYALLIEQFKYDQGLSNYAFYWNDPKY